MNKYKEHRLTQISAHKVKSALIEECYGNLECNVWNHFEWLDHTLIVGEVIAASVNE